MKRTRFRDFRRTGTRRFCVVCGLLMLSALTTGSGAEPAADAVSAFQAYIGTIEARLARQHGSADHFVVWPVGEGEAQLRRGELLVEQVTPALGRPLPGAMLHHWRGTAFAPGATAAQFERLLRNFDAYPKVFAPEVLNARSESLPGNRMQAWMRVRQRHVITVVMDSDYDVAFGQLDARHGYSISRSTRITEIDAPGTNSERAMTSTEEHGFLWRLDTYWSYEERNGGLYMQIESVSLTRAIPAGLGWAVRPFVESVPRESMEFTLRSAREGLGNRQ